MIPPMITEANFAVKHLADDVALLVLDNPWLILVAVFGAEGFKTSLGCVVHVLAVHEQLPRPYVAVVHSVQDNAHALVGCDERADTKNKSDGCQGPVSSSSAAQSDDQGNDDAGGNETNAQCASEEHTCRVTIANRPSDKVGVSLVPKTGVNCLEDAAESTRHLGLAPSTEDLSTHKAVVHQLPEMPLMPGFGNSWR
ncbi:hypothetical protein HG530_002196 [Fusarium avenaceum]|nr:hypothetical protein HG530_002196 [Fusarium avenaceum]